MRQRLIPLFAMVLATRPAPAQVRASEHATVQQTIDGATITLEFYRPMVRGRTLFGQPGAVVRSGEPWTPGANWATTIDASRDIWLSGHRLPQGKYGVWLLPRDTGDWTLFFDPVVRRFHTNRAKPDSAVLQLAVRPEQGPELEGLMWYFPAVGGDTATLRLHWGSTLVTMPLRVEPSKPKMLSASERAAYLGSYRLSWAGSSLPPNIVEITAAPEGIRGRSNPPLMPGTDADFDLYPAGQDSWRVVVHRGGKPFDTEWVELHFIVEKDRATGIEVPNPRGDRIFGRAVRLP